MSKTIIRFDIEGAVTMATEMTIEGDIIKFAEPNPMYNEALYILEDKMLYAGTRKDGYVIAMSVIMNGEEWYPVTFEMALKEDVEPSTRINTEGR